MFSNYFLVQISTKEANQSLFLQYFLVQISTKEAQSQTSSEPQLHISHLSSPTHSNEKTDDKVCDKDKGKGKDNDKDKNLTSPTHSNEKTDDKVGSKNVPTKLQRQRQRQR